MLHAWHRANFADRLYLVYFVGVGLLILLLRHQVPGWPVFLTLHLLCTAMVLVLVLTAERVPTAHAWYPLAMPLIMFEEVARLSRFASPLVTEILNAGYSSFIKASCSRVPCEYGTIGSASPWMDRIGGRPARTCVTGETTFVTSSRSLLLPTHCTAQERAFDPPSMSLTSVMPNQLMMAATEADRAETSRNLPEPP